MAVRVEKHTVFCLVSATSGSPDDVMIVPTRESRDFLAADRANPLLLFPEVKQLSSSPKVVGHVHTQPFLKVDFPLGIIRIGFPFDFGMSPDGYAGGID